MKKLILLTLVLFSVLSAFSQDMTKFKLYSPEANAKKEIEEAVKEAKNSGKHVMIQIGGNWCIWCARFNDFVTNDKSLDSLLKSNYVVYHLNYSKENKNADLLKKYEFPQRFGYPVFLVLNEKGDLIHTQSSWFLEAGKSYDKEKVTAFFSDWSRKALDPAQYKEQ
ncbi:MAG TPA: thioredoxin family protein [Chitinophagaceae bacterium]|jgi:thioredoxin-related protein|nr:thioredoxin family protein [Chitinophagaceae bacterium]